MESGTRLGPYEIVSRIGAGGMGEVWKARDTRLDRSVAVKILPAEFADNAQLRLRFEREAKMISQLQHPHICSLFDVGDGYLVMELLEGESLADRLARGALPLGDVLKFGAQIAQALDRAHRTGIVHRDLKPGNIMITRSGAKLLDFGLARSAAAPAVDIDQATVQKPLTQEGAILGTFQYMAPEQLSGEEADTRSDIFALGAVLYEMTTGKRAFEGKTRTSLVSQIVGGEPRPIRDLQPMTPSTLEHVIRKCLAKDGDERWQSASDIGSQLRWIGESSMEAAHAQSPRSRPRWGMALTAIAVIAAVAFGALWMRSSRGQETRLVSSIVPPAGTAFNFEQGVMMLSPDGLRIAMLVADKGVTHLHVYDMQTGQTRRIEATSNASSPFWSPDGQTLAFFADGHLKTVGITNGPPQIIAAATGPRGGAWNQDGTIVYAPRFREGLSSIPSAGGKPQELTRTATGEISHRWPLFLPDGEHVLFLVQRAEGGATDDPSTIDVISLVTKARREVLRANSSVAYSNGFLLFWRDGSLLAQPFDEKNLRLTGTPVQIAADVSLSGLEQMMASTATGSGTLVYRAGGKIGESRLVWSNRAGMNSALHDNFALRTANYFGPALSPDGKTIAVSMVDQTEDIHAIDVERLTNTRMTFGPTDEDSPIWSPDGQWLALRSNRIDPGDVYLKSAKGDRPEQPLLVTPDSMRPTSWSSDGRFLLLERIAPGANLADLWVYSFDDKSTRALVETPFEECGGVFSPDGRWVAYTSTESGKPEVYIRAFEGDAKWQVSTDRGWMPKWSRDGKELFFMAANNGLMSVKVAFDPDFRATKPELLFTYRPKMRALRERDVAAYDTTHDPGLLLLNVLTANSDAPITVVQNWAAGLKR
jgi:eukaryotic-like serine/threonine-protein kinase